MGRIWTHVTLCNMDKTRCVDTEALVDTGATLPIVPRRLAEHLGIKAIRKDRVETGSGVIEIDRGVAVFRLQDRETLCETWISDIVDKVLVGVVLLELLGFRVDPRTGRLERVLPMLY